MRSWCLFSPCYSESFLPETGLLNALNVLDAWILGRSANDFLQLQEPNVLQSFWQLSKVLVYENEFDDSFARRTYKLERLGGLSTEE